jgi:hypothetical protein
MSQDAGPAADRTLPRLPRATPAAARIPVATPVPVVDPDRHVERLPLAVPIDGPDGVGLGDILAAARSVAPAVRGVAVRGRALTVISDRPPQPAERDALTTLLADGTRLTRLARSAPAVKAPDLTRVLLDDATGDQEWLRAFRQYAVTHLIPREEKTE